MTYTLNENDDPNGLCGSCCKLISSKQKHIKCNICYLNFHIKCSKIDIKSFENMEKRNDEILCLKCRDELLPFSHSIDDYKKKDPVLSESIKLFFKGLNEFNDESNDENYGNLSTLDCKYVDIESFNYKIKSVIYLYSILT